jgi:small multidrug resistance pump
MAYFYLAIAIICEVIATSALKASQEFTKPLPSLLVLCGYSCAFYFLAYSLKEIPIGIAYALWAGIGIVLVACIGTLFYQQKLDRPAILGIAFILIGVLIINIYSNIKIH